MELLFITLDRLIAMERKYGMVGTIVGIAIIILCTMLTIFGIKVLLQTNFNVVAWVCENFFGFKLY